MIALNHTGATVLQLSACQERCQQVQKEEQTVQGSASQQG